MRASGSMLLAAGPLAPWGAWSLWAALSSRQWLAVALPVAWLFAVWQLAARGWPYPDWRRTILVLIPRTLFVLICAGGAWVVHRQYQRVAGQL